MISGEVNLPLQNRDTVRIFGLAEIRRLLDNRRPTMGEREPLLDDRDGFFERRDGRRTQRDPLTPGRDNQGTARDRQRSSDEPGGNRRELLPQDRMSEDGWRDSERRRRDEFPERRESLFPQDRDEEGFFPQDRRQSRPDFQQRPPGQSGWRNLDRTARDDPYLSPAFLRRQLRESLLEVLGQFASPGQFPVVGTITLEEAFTAAGGVLSGADLSQVEVTRFPLNRDASRRETQRVAVDLRAVPPRLVSVSAGDTILVSPLVSDRERGLVELGGDVRRPGRYAIIRGEKLSSFLERAGGLQPTAYPAGAVFTRESVRRAEASAWQRTAREFHRALLGRLTEPTTPTPGQPASTFTPEQVQLLTELLDRMNETEAVGRMVVEVNPIVLKQRPELDITLEGGDRLFIPRIPLSVFVSGEVYNPGAQQFAIGRSVTEYIEAAGGLAEDAERSSVFIIRPDGSAQRVSLSAWGRGGEVLAPGSWIVVPRDLTPFRFRDLALTVGQLFSNLAVAAASLVVISQNN